ncbi:hypothetical protein [Cognatilysobacter bugurensis]|uniref:Histidine kinase n=1 Tax=Cognatilysobacter bugurensis TaxID=543356 RepID=A0A918W9M5_9GAMM|nr:hypothetical protein [Lysobacter bugurensis]GHA80487.1 hypothetical protein GCM10007067_17870 [Lysobacter bugurensis]
MSIDDDMLGALAHDPDARAKWVHDLRNALNVMGVGARLAQRMIEKGQPDDAAAVLADSMRAWTQCNALLAHANEATSLVALPPEARASVSEWARAQE